MKFYVLAAMVLILTIAGVRPFFAADLGFRATNINSPDLGSQGVTGASMNTGFLNTVINDSRGLQPNRLPGFNVVDVAVGNFNADENQDIASVSADDSNGDGIADTGSLIIFFGLGDGSFQLPRLIRTAGLPASVAVADIELDGVDDIVVAEQGFVEVFTGFFLVTGIVTDFDRFGIPGNNLPGGALKTVPGNTVISVALGRLDTDPLIDIVVAERGLSNGMVEVFLTAPNSVSYNPMGNSDLILDTNGQIGISSNGPVPAPRAIAIDVSNQLPDPNSPDPNQGLDQDFDIFVATSNGVQIFENDSTDPVNPVFTPSLTLVNGTFPVGVLVVDVNNDGRLDVLRDMTPFLCPPV
jgi:hypothetical protein